MKSVLIIEDDQNILNLFQLQFENEVAIEFTIASSYSEGVSFVAQKKFDIYILDINLTGHSGFDILKILQKEEAITNRVVIISADIKPETKIEAYNLGVSNFVPKPIDFNVLKAVLRKNLRAIDDAQPDSISTKQFKLDLKIFKCFKIKEGELIEVSLTKIEFNILLDFAKNLDKVRSKEVLSFLGKNDIEPMSFKALEMHISSLRKKLGNEVIHTVRGHGYYISS